jgi:hypothetical protein
MNAPPTLNTGDPSYFVPDSTSGRASAIALTFANASLLLFIIPLLGVHRDRRIDAHRARRGNRAGQQRDQRHRAANGGKRDRIECRWSILAASFAGA